MKPPISSDSFNTCPSVIISTSPIDKEIQFRAQYTQGRRKHGGGGGSSPRCPNNAGAMRGQLAAPFGDRKYLRTLTIKRWTL